MVIDLLKDQRPFVNPDLEIESEATRREVKSLVDRILETGEGAAAVGTVMAFEQGFLPVPFTNSRRYAEFADVITVRDAEGGVRFVDFGLDEASKEYHREKVRERERLEQRKVDYELLAQSILSSSQGTLAR